MPDTRRHRGAHPADERLFSENQLPGLRAAVFELSWLFSRGYASPSALKLVGDRHRLNTRQRLALARAACSDRDVETRKAACLAVEAMTGKHLVVDGFNLLITIEAALSGGILLLCRDGCIRDLASVHGSYRSVEETRHAVNLIGEVFDTLTPLSVKWVFDKPVSNSGKIAGLIRDIAATCAWPWTAEVVFNPDTVISLSPDIVLTSDSSILDRVAQWVNFSLYLIEHYLPQAWIVDLRGAAM